MTNNKIRFTAIGDVGVDMYPSSQLKLPGGTALNSAIFASQVGAEAAVISAIGTDSLSKIPLQALQKWHVDILQLNITEGKTDRVDIKIDNEGRPTYKNWELGVLDGFKLTESHQQFLATQHIAIAVHLPELEPMFEDFAAMEFKKTIKVADFTDLSEYKGDVAVIKKYMNQFDMVALSIDASDKERLASFYDIADEHKKMAIALMGKDGSAVYFEGSLFYQDAKKVAVVDTTGAGDMYLSVFLVQYLQTQDIRFSMEKATEKASNVIQHLGAVE